MGEVLFFALMAVFILYKLFSILGNTNEFDEKRVEDKKKNIFTNTIFGESCGTKYNTASDKNAESNSLKPISAQIISENEVHLSDNVIQSLRAISELHNRYNQSFSTDSFLNGAKKAFNIIHNSALIGDKETLDKLVSKGILEKLMTIYESWKKFSKFDDIKEIKSIKILRASANNLLVSIVVEIESLRLFYIKDQNGKIVEGNENDNILKKENWTFVKHMAVDNNWKLVDMS